MFGTTQAARCHEQTDEGIHIRGKRRAHVVDRRVGLQGVAALRRSAAHAALRDARLNAGVPRRRGVAAQAGAGSLMFAEAVPAVGGARFPQPVPVLPRVVRGLRPPSCAGSPAPKLHLAHCGGHSLGTPPQAADWPGISGRDHGELLRRPGDLDTRRSACLSAQRPGWHVPGGR